MRLAKKKPQSPGAFHEIPLYRMGFYLVYKSPVVKQVKVTPVRVIKCFSSESS